MLASCLLASVCTDGVLAVTTGITADASSTNGHPVASAARRVDLAEVAKLTFHGEKGAAVVDYGEAKGTYNAPLKAEMTLHGTYVSAVVTISPKGGTITGTAHASFTALNALLYFGGTFTLGHGTGRFRHISEIKGKPLGISGVLIRTRTTAKSKPTG